MVCEWHRTEKPYQGEVGIGSEEFGLAFILLAVCLTHVVQLVEHAVATVYHVKL